MEEADSDGIRKTFAEVDRILRLATKRARGPVLWTDRIDHVVLHPVWGSLLLVLILAFVFQIDFDLGADPHGVD